MMAGRIDDGGDWPDELWFYDSSRWPSHCAWLDAALRYAKAHGYKKLPIIQSMTTDCTELPAACREKPVARNLGHLHNQPRGHRT
jgi:hypothetical protein